MHYEGRFYIMPSIHRCGERAVSIEFGQIISEDINNIVLAFEQMLIAHPLNGIVETIPSYCSLLICFNPLVISFEMLCEEIENRLQRLYFDYSSDSRLWTIPCCYGMHFGMDMDMVCCNAGLSEKEVIALHCKTDYRVYMLGFLPGFVYLGGLNLRLETPRLKTPRTAVPRGSVGIGGNQTGIYPVVSPGGWNIIGCTPFELFTPCSNEPVLCRAGDYLRFVPISADEYYSIRRDVIRGKYIPENELRRL